MCGQWKQITLTLLLCLLSALSIHAQEKTTEDKPAKTPPKIIGYKVTLVDGYSFDVDEVSKQGDETWFRKGNIQRQIQGAIKSVKPIYEQPKVEAAAETAKTVTTSSTTTTTPTKPAAPEQIWIYLIDGAKFRVDQVQEQADGAWYSRHNVSIFLAKERISRIEYESPETPANTRKTADWTSGSVEIDHLIRTNANRFGIDPYLVFLVIEKESRFHTRALSPKGAMGLMQLMPSTARRL